MVVVTVGDQDATDVFDTFAFFGQTFGQRLEGIRRENAGVYQSRLGSVDEIGVDVAAGVGRRDRNRKDLRTARSDPHD